MKLKTIPATFSISLAVLVLVIVFTAPARAQTTDKKPQTSKMMAAANTDNPRIKPGAIDLNTGKTPALAENKTNSTNDAGDWFDKGALCATYGNDRAAINYFQKALSLNPSLSGAYFEQGISYGQLDNFFKAIALINKAIEMNPHNGLYYYGRARVFLLNDEKEKAMEDFKKAAELDDEDAQNYLNTIAKAQ